MLLSLVKVEDLIRAFHLDPENEDLLCIYLDSKGNKGLSELLRQRSQVDGILGTRVAFMIFAPNFTQEVTSLSSVSGEARSVPAVSIKAVTGFLRRTHQRPDRVAVTAFLDELANDHVDYVEDLYSYFGIDAASLPAVILIVRGQLAPPSHIRVPPELTGSQLVQWLQGLSNCAERIEAKDLGERWDFLERANAVAELQGSISDEINNLEAKVQRSLVWLREQPVDHAHIDRLAAIAATQEIPSREFLELLITDEERPVLDKELKRLRRRLVRLTELREERDQLHRTEEEHKRRLYEVLAGDEELRKQFVSDIESETSSLTNRWSPGFGVIVPSVVSAVAPMVGKAIWPTVWTFLRRLWNG
jgi:hypothetical protein